MSGPPASFTVRYTIDAATAERIRALVGAAVETGDALLVADILEAAGRALRKNLRRPE